MATSETARPLFALQACGIEAAAVPTVLLSNHPHYSTIRGRVLEPDLVRDLLAGVEERGLIDKCKILISGYLGSPGIAAVVIDFVRRVKARNPVLLYLCDPVMGDSDLGLFVSEQLRALFCEGLVPLADIITPNQFELELLTGCPVATTESLSVRHAGLGPRLWPSPASMRSTPRPIGSRPWQLNQGLLGSSQPQGLVAAHAERAISSRRSLRPR